MIYPYVLIHKQIADKKNGTKLNILAFPRVELASRTQDPPDFNRMLYQLSYKNKL